MSPLGCPTRAPLALTLALTLLGCAEAPTSPQGAPTTPADLRAEVEGLSPISLRLTDAPGRDNRHDYEITNPPITSPHALISDEVWRLGPAPMIEGDAITQASLDEPAPYTRGTPPRLVVNLGWRGDGAPPALIALDLEGTLRSTTAPHQPAVELLRVSAQVAPLRAEPVGQRGQSLVFEGLVVDAAPLPDRVDLFELTLSWSMTPIAADGRAGQTVSRQTTHLIPTSLRAPRDFVRYKQIVTWASAWAAGDWIDHGPDDPRTAESVHQIALAMLAGIRSLEDEGYRYGPVVRPDKADFQSWADTLLDKKQAACGEFRGLMIALLEYHGVDATRVWFNFPDPSPDRLAFYETRPIAAVGTPARPWFDTNHSVVSVGGRIYDPTYTAWAESWGDYEDWLFVSYCRGFGRPCAASDPWCHEAPEDASARCVPNPPGFDPGGDMEVTHDDPRR